MPESTETGDTGDQLEAELHDMLAEARRLGNRIYAGESIPGAEMDAFYARRDAVFERLDAPHRENGRGVGCG